jgi:aryl-alcohol dehydrogenase (NADP+)
MAWVASRPGIDAPIVGATKTHHLEEAVAALDLELTDDEVAALEEPYRPHQVAGFR